MFNKNLIISNIPKDSNSIVYEELVVKNINIPMLVFHDTGIYIFFNYKAIDKTAIKNKIIKAQKEIAYALDVSEESVFIYNNYNNDIWQLNSNNTIEKVQLLFELLFKENPSIFNEEEALIICDRIENNDFKETEEESLESKIMTIEDGTVFFKDGNGLWVQGSDLNTEEEFKMNLYGGLVGLPKFKNGEYFNGLVQIVTCGGFLLGWLFETLPFFTNSKKDKYGKLYAPLKSRKKYVLPFIGMFIVNIIIFIIYYNILLKIL